MSALLQPMPRPARAAYQETYVRYLHSTDGAPDLDRRTLPTREAFFRELAAEPVRRPLADQAAFDRGVNARSLAPGLDERTLWALAVAKVNRAERYGVERKLQRKGFEAAGAADPYTFVELQELYHTRIFVSLLDTVGITADILPPAGMTRVVVSSFGELPHAFTDVIAIAAEIAGIAAFQLLLAEAERLFADEPVVLRRVTLLFRQILADEIGHVLFLRSRLGAGRLAAARALLPLVTRGMIDDMPELVALLGRDRYLDEVRRLDLAGALSRCPDRVPPLPEG